MINIDECLQETCESGCYNFLNVTGKPNMVSIRGSSIVGVETFVQGKCGCHEPVSQECDATYCYNGGTCKKDYWNVLRLVLVKRHFILVRVIMFYTPLETGVF